MTFLVSWYLTNAFCSLAFKLFPLKKKKIPEFIVTDLNVQPLMLVRHTLWVGSSCLYCALEDAPGQPTWPAFAQKGTLFPGGPVLFVSLLETFSHALRQPKCHQTPMFTQLNLTHSETLQSVQKG